MKDSLTKSKEDEKQSISNDPVNQQPVTSGLEDNSPEAVSMREFQSQVDGSEEMQDLSKYQDKIGDKTSGDSPVEKPNKTGIPDELKTSIEQLSGFSLDDVKVHYNSDKPALLEAHAYAEGNDIYVAPGQEKHLAHEVWHVIQQKGGKVQATVQLKGEVPVNDDKGLEKEADVMGDKAIQLKGKDTGEEKELAQGNTTGDTVQRLKWSEREVGKKQKIELTESQVPDGVESTKETKDRNVFAGSKSGSSGYGWFKKSTLEVQYNVKEMMQYKIIDPKTVFYTAVRNSAIDPIREKGIDPNYGNVEEPSNSTEYNVRGFNYFGKDDKIPKTYGKFLGKKKDWQIISFTLPEGTLIERDPEIPGGLRTMHHIQPGDITFN